MIILHFYLQPRFKMNYFIYTSHHSTPHGRYELTKLTSLPMCGFIAQLVEQRTGNAEVTGSNPVEALIFFFRLLLSNCLNWKIYYDDHSPLSKSVLSARRVEGGGGGGTYWDMPSANRTSFVYQFLCSPFLRSEAGDWCTIASESWFQSHTS